MAPSPLVYLSPDENDLVGKLQSYLSEKLFYLLEQTGTIGIGVSGGSMTRIFSAAILAIPNLNWKRIRIFMVDERNVDVNDPESNLGQYLRLFPVDKHDSFVPIPIHENVGITAQQYEINLRRHLLPEQFNSAPRFDLLFLGVGPDGHTASIFPGKERLEKITDMNWVSAITDSPKPPPARVTLTIGTINFGKNVAFIITGRAKAEIVRSIVEGDEKYPASTVKPINEKLVLFLDSEAGSAIRDQERLFARHDEMSSPEPETPPFE